MFLEVCLGTIYWSTSTRPGPVTVVCVGLPFLSAKTVPNMSLYRPDSLFQG